MRKNIVAALIMISFLLILFSGCGSKPSFRRVTPEEAQKMMENSENFIILDVRTYEEYCTGHLRNSVNWANENIDEEIYNFIDDRDHLVFVYCRTGRRSLEAAEKLSRLGYTNIVEMGGIVDWKGEIVKN